jgi:glycosyltransferase involved in cell wall biosynthesis
LVIAGEGQERAFVEHEAKANNRIVYVGRVAHQQIPGLVAGSIASISPQTAFGLRSVAGMSPVKIYESMACGVPVIATDVQGVADPVRKHECGIVVPSNNPRSIADAVAYISYHPDKQRQMGERGRTAVLREHSWDQRADSTSGVLKALIDDRSLKTLALRAGKFRDRQNWVRRIVIRGFIGINK